MKKLYEKYRKAITVLLIISLSVSTITAGAVYMYFSHTRTYSASVVFEFTNNGAKDGYANDGTPINFDEIKGAEILSRAIEKYNHPESEMTIDSLAASLQIEEIIPKEEQDKIDSALKNGKEYEFHPTQFMATLTTPEKETAWLLQCIADSYYEYYAEKHVVKSALPAMVNIENYDYIEIADELRNMILSDQAFLAEANVINPDFRCTTNGYLFSDIMAEYDIIYNNEIPKLYSMILNQKASKNPALLLQILNKKIAQGELLTEDTNVSIATVKSLISSYSEKNKAQNGINDYNNLIDENHQNIMDYVYENETSPTATYDNLFKRFYSELDTVSFNSIDSDYYRYLISVFQDAEPATDEAVVKTIENQIDYIYRRCAVLHELSREAKKENDAIQTAKVLKQLNTPYANATGHLKIYTILAFAAMNIFMMIAIPVLFIFKRKVEVYIKENNLV